MLHAKKNNANYEIPFTEYDKLHSVEVEVEVLYDKPINGFEVSVTCVVDTTNNTDSPQTQDNRNAVVGRGYIHFKNKELEFMVETPCFTDSALLANEKTLHNNLHIHSIYKDFTPTTTDKMILQGNNVPFFFYDMDMDGQKELVITVFEGMEYHGHNSYEVYKLRKEYNHTILLPLLEPPFDEVNDYTEFDFTEKTITPHHVDAVKLLGDSIYKMP